MYCFVVFVFYFVALVGARVKVSTNYHMDIGIPEANRIKKVENEMLADQNRNVTRRIVGGARAPPYSHPYLAGLIAILHNNPETSVCGSSVISANRLVTAAHCWHSSVPPFVREFIVVLGSQFLFRGGTRIPTSDVLIHPKYNTKYYINDLAIIYLPYPVKFSNIIQPIALPQYNLWESFVGKIATALGYGKTYDEHELAAENTVVNHVNLRVIPVQLCKDTFEFNFVQDSNICTDGHGGVGVCGGDSGGPLVMNYNGRNILVGVSSFVAKSGCQLGYPSAFTRVTSFYNFIHRNL